MPNTSDGYIRRSVGHIKVVRTELSHIADITARDNDAGVVGNILSSPEIQNTLIGKGDAKTIMLNDEVLAILGKVYIRKDFCEVWVLPSCKIYQHRVIFVRVLKELFEAELEHDTEVRRFQATTVSTPKNNRWLAWLGFEYEGLLRNYGAFCENVSIWSIIRDEKGRLIKNGPRS